MSTPSLNTAVSDVLKQGCIFLDRVGDEAYARPLEGEFAASLGAHYRHVLSAHSAAISMIRHFLIPDRQEIAASCFHAPQSRFSMNTSRST
jgi:hypothetical protein